MAGNPNYEHIHLMNCDSKVINIGNWKIKSVSTGDVYTFPSYVPARAVCNPTVFQITVNTHRAGNENNTNIFTWDKPTSVEEWPRVPQRVQVFDSSGTKKIDCGYQPDPAKSEVSCQ